jgi:hypothetical protein
VTNLLTGYVDINLVIRKQKFEITYKVNRKISLTIGNYKVSCFPEIILGTLLFIQYTDDLPLGINSFFKPFLSADDARVKLLII